MMRKLLLGSVVTLALSGAAVAADIPARAPAIPAPILTQVYFSWTGLYVGLNAGGAWGGNGCSSFYPVDAAGTRVAGFPATGCAGGDRTAFTGGAQIGYNWQFGSMVAGVEADLNYLGGRRNRTSSMTVVGLPDPEFDGAYVISEGRQFGNYFGTVRARFGFALDRALIYATGGLAWSDSGRASTVAFTGPGTAAVYTQERRGDRIGWTIGAGIEYALTNRWTVKAEYLYADIGGRRGGGYTCAGTACGPQFGGAGAYPGGRFVGGRGDNGLHVVRVGVNYLFNSTPAGGVVARY